MTTLFTTCVDITEKVIKQQTITAASLPIIATLRSASGADITSTLFDISALNLDATYWTVVATTVTNSLDINFGAAISNYALPLFLRLTGSDGTIFATSLLNTVIETGNSLVLYAGASISFTLNFGSIILSNAILNLIFKGNNIFPSTFLSAKYFDNSNTLQATITLAATKWSVRYTGTLGEIYFEYGNTQTLPSINAVIDLVKITDSSGNVWFEFPIALPTNLKPNAVIYSNSLVLRIPDINVDLTSYISPSNSSSSFFVDFNGRVSEQSNNSAVASFTGSEYNSVDKLFGTECLICSSTTNVQYSGVAFPNTFTLNAFIYFTNATTGRLTTLAEKNGVFAVKKTATNNLEVSVNGTVVITTPYSPLISQWQHIWVQKRAGQLQLRVNNSDIDVTANYSTAIASNTNLFSVCGGILGLCNGIYLESGESAFSLMVQPLPKRRNDWSDISLYEWLNVGFTQVKQYF